ncbi:MAG: MscL family protein [Candidatus Coatesbacteria bacterium]|nr:MAG: MscL family protein [Candidatus Coatesbacteria bacterium]
MAVDREFRNFIKKFGLGVALGIIIAGAVEKFLSALIEGIFFPLVNLALGNDQWGAWTISVGTAEIKAGEITAAFVEFMVIILLLFLFVKLFLGVKKIPA